MPVYLAVGYFFVINLIALAITYYDKKASKRHRRRVRENTLMLVGALGGAPVMYLTMKVIRHKTKHFIFMFGLPLIFIIEVAIVIFIAFSSKVFG
ncbi:MAG: DUF1294 domain-containing protein [Ruminococcus sp.]|nr:DUF1294 domain-containing protein [Ruminococcus sp.]